MLNDDNNLQNEKRNKKNRRNFQQVVLNLMTMYRQGVRKA